MGLEDIFRALEQEAEARCAEIRMQANAEAGAIEADSEKRCEELVREKLARAAAPLEARARRVVSDARFERRRSIAAEREAQVDAAYVAAREALGSLRSDASYEATFGRLLDEALASSVSPSAVLVDPADEAMATRALSARGLDIPLKAEASSAGGVVVLSGAGRVRHDNTFEARLERVQDTTRTLVGELLFG